VENCVGAWAAECVLKAGSLLRLPGNLAPASKDDKLIGKPDCDDRPESHLVATASSKVSLKSGQTRPAVQPALKPGIALNSSLRKSTNARTLTGRWRADAYSAWTSIGCMVYPVSTSLTAPAFNSS
jgi:hypothetical protein